MSGIALVSVLAPCGALDAIWRVNPQARQSFAGMGFGAPILMSVVCVACALAAVGLLRRRHWGRLLAIAILCVNLIGDTVAAFIRDDLRTLIGLPIAGSLIAYLMLTKVRRWFTET